MDLTWYGQSCFEIETQTASVLVDPFIEENPKCDTSQSGISPDLVAVTHGHFDHAAEADAFDVPVIAQPEVAKVLSDRGYDETVKVNIGGTYEERGIKFTMVQAFHSSGMSSGDGTDLYGGTPAGYVINTGDVTLYHAGDTGLFGDMKTVIGDVYEPDIAIVPIGDLYTMGPEEAGVAADWTGAETAIPMHYDTWPPIEQDPEVFRRATDADVIVLDIGETVTF